MLSNDLRRFRKIWTGFQSARVLLTANNLEIFEHLKTPLTAKELANSLSLDLRATTLLLDALVGLGLLKKTAQRYSNTILSRLFLLRDGLYYQGDILRHADTLWHNWSSLDEVIRTGKPARNRQNWDAFIRGMHNVSVIKAKKVIEALPLKTIKTAIDIGGGPGTYSIELAKKGIEVTLFDFADTLEIAKEIAHSEGVKEGITYKVGDIITDELTENYDLVFISQLLHAYDAQQNQSIIKKSADALNPEGILVVQEFYLADNMAKPSESSLFSINMLVNTEGGRCYTPKEITTWLKQAGLNKVVVKQPVDTVLLIASR